MVDIVALKSELQAAKYAGKSAAQCLAILIGQTASVSAPFTWGAAVVAMQKSANFSWPRIIARSKQSPTLPPASGLDYAILAAINAVSTPMDRIIDSMDTVGWATVQGGMQALQGVGDMTAADVAAIVALVSQTLPAWPGITIRDVWIALGQPE